MDRPIADTDAFIEASRAAEFAGLGVGSHRVIVHLRSSTGVLVAERPASVDIRDTRLVTLVITRDCRGVACDDPARSACLQGQCVPEAWTPETPETCSTPACETPADCDPAPAACAEAQCTAGACLLAARTPRQCTPDLYCDPEHGCRASPPDSRTTCRPVASLPKSAI